MKALLLAAGLGTRLKEISDFVPKNLAPINGVPLICQWFESMHGTPIDGILVNLHYKADFVRSFIESIQVTPAPKLVFEENLLGTGGTLLKNAAFFGETPTLVAHGDNLSTFDINAFIAAHHRRPKGTLITMLTFETPQPRSCGIVKLDSQNRVQEFHEKVANPPGNLANGAIYVFEPEVLHFIRSLGREFVDLSKDVIPHFMGKIYAFHNDGLHRDIGDPETYVKAQIEYRPTTRIQHYPCPDWFRFSPLPKKEFVDGFLGALIKTTSGRARWVDASDLGCETPTQWSNELLAKSNRHDATHIFFKDVPAHFTSYDFHQKFGLNSFALSRG